MGWASNVRASRGMDAFDMLDTLPDAADASDAEAEPGVGGRDAAGQEEALADAVACVVDGRAVKD